MLCSLHRQYDHHGAGLGSLVLLVSPDRYDLPEFMDLLETGSYRAARFLMEPGSLLMRHSAGGSSVKSSNGCSSRFSAAHREISLRRRVVQTNLKPPGYYGASFDYCCAALKSHSQRYSGVRAGGLHAESPTARRSRRRNHCVASRQRSRQHERHELEWHALTLWEGRGFHQIATPNRIRSMRSTFRHAPCVTKSCGGRPIRSSEWRCDRRIRRNSPRIHRFSKQSRRTARMATRRGL